MSVQPEEPTEALVQISTEDLTTTETKWEVQAAVIVAKNYPRSEDDAYAKLIRACQRSSFAEDALYSFPRGGATVEGPSINLAREAARVWKNVRYGIEILRDDEESRRIRGWAWDVENNTKIASEDEFKKQVQRKNKKTGVTEWLPADERDLRELTNRRGAILVRNCILQLLPRDFIEDSMQCAKATIKSEAQANPEDARKRLILAFSELNITPAMLARKLGHPLAQCSPTEIADLRKVYKSINDGNSTWSEYQPERPAGGAVASQFVTPGQQVLPSKIIDPGASEADLALPFEPVKESFPTVYVEQTQACPHDQGFFDEIVRSKVAGEPDAFVSKCVKCGTLESEIES